MEKPLTIQRKEMIVKICEAINGSNLPAFAIRDVLKTIDAELAELQEKQYQQDVQAWTVYQIKSKKAEESGDGDHCSNNNGTD